MSTIKQSKQKIIERLIEMSGKHSAIARDIGVDPSTLSKIARAGINANPTVNLLIALEEYLLSDEPAQTDTLPNSSSFSGKPDNEREGVALS